ncbi:MAG: DegV family protein [Acidimicrobiia bacterium]|nr:DegV family protein [Acidimicrobiia bacterium]
MGVRIVTDSSCDLPEDLVEQHRIEIVPLTIRFGHEELIDRKELSTAEFWDRVRNSDLLPETAAPSAGAFEEAFRRLVTEGADEIVCVNISSQLSATMQSAKVAAEAVRGECRVEVVDSRSVSMGLGNLCVAAARLADDGARTNAILADLADRRDRTRLFGTLDTLDFLRKGGRIGAAQHLLGSVLSIKPLIEIDGTVTEGGKVRTRSKALRVLAERVRDAGPLEALAVPHSQATDIDDFLAVLAETVPGVDPLVCQLGPVVGTHGGPGVIGVTFQVVRSG